MLPPPLLASAPVAYAPADARMGTAAAPSSVAHHAAGFVLGLGAGMAAVLLLAGPGASFASGFLAQAPPPQLRAGDTVHSGIARGSGPRLSHRLRAASSGGGPPEDPSRKGGRTPPATSFWDTPILDANDRSDQGPVAELLKKFVRSEPELASVTFSVVVILLLVGATRLVLTLL